jgi:hypothetical protein
MKQIIWTVLFFLSYNDAIGDCGHFVQFYPEKDDITENSYIIIEGQGDDTPWGIIPIIEGLGSTYPIYLTCNKQRIKLNLKDLIKGQSGRVQAIFYPDEKLIFGNRYELAIENLTCDEENNFKDKKKYNTLLKRYDFKSWTVTKCSDYENPMLLKQPNLIEKELIGYGCGPAINAIFSIEAEDESEMLVLVELTEIETNTVRRYYLGVRESKIYVGRGMCSGAFEFKLNMNYEARFKIYDINGNTNNVWTNTVEFSSPIFC